MGKDPQGTFQFLIGSMRQRYTVSIISNRNMFQFLIGSMRHNIFDSETLSNVFQFLIGSMRHLE